MPESLPTQGDLFVVSAPSGAGKTSLVRALIDSDGSQSSLLVCNDHEEVGSVSASGAGGPLLLSLINRLAGDHAAYEALFKKDGVIEVNDFNEMAAVLMMFQNERNPGSGGLGAMLESGGFREFIADWAHELGIDFGAISAETKTSILSRPLIRSGSSSKATRRETWAAKRKRRKTKALRAKMAKQREIPTETVSVP